MFVATRIITITAISLFISISLNGQEYTKAIGVRGAFGYDHYQYAGAEFSFQKDVKKIGRSEYDFGWYASSQWDVLKFTGIRQWKIVNKTKFHFYGGAGGGAGLVMYSHAENEFFASLNLNMGVDYTLGFIQLALDWRPEWTIINNFGTQLGYDFGFAIRFAIP
jgi:hypothetical protein